MTKRGLAAYGNISASESTHALPSRLSPALPPLLPPNPFFSLFSLSPALSLSLRLPLSFSLSSLALSLPSPSLVLSPSLSSPSPHSSPSSLLPLFSLLPLPIFSLLPLFSVPALPLSLLPPCLRCCVTLMTHTHTNHTSLFADTTSFHAPTL